MNITLISDSPLALPFYKTLVTLQHTVCLAFQKKISEYTFSISTKKNTSSNTNYFKLSKYNIEKTFPLWLINHNIDLVIVLGFSLKLPTDVLKTPKYGCINIHFGKLPENRGGDPVFWSIKNRVSKTAITVHKMNENWDEGAIVLEKEVSIIPGETYGMLSSKMSMITSQLTEKIIENTLQPTLHENQSTNNCNYNKKPTKEVLTINWENQTADAIEFLVNACNPKYQGATTYYQGMPIKIIEVSPVSSSPIKDKKPGEIIHAHPQEGLYVYCKQGQLLKINCMSSDAGILSGTKYVQLGIQQGHHFTSTLNKKVIQKQNII